MSSVCVLVIKMGMFYFFGTEMDYMFSYISPFILFNAVVLLEIGRGETEIKNEVIKKTIILISGLTFDIYILHSHVMVFEYIMKNRFGWISTQNIFAIIPVVILIAILIFVQCLIIAFIRMKIFEVLKVNEKLINIEKFIDEKKQKHIW